MYVDILRALGYTGNSMEAPFHLLVKRGAQNLSTVSSSTVNDGCISRGKISREPDRADYVWVGDWCSLTWPSRSSRHTYSTTKWFIQPNTCAQSSVSAPTNAIRAFFQR